MISAASTTAIPCGFFARNLSHPLILGLDHGRMHNGIQLPNAIGESDSGQRGAIDRPIVIENFPAKMTHHFVIHRGSRRIQLVRQQVGLEQMRAAPDQHLADSRFATRDPAGEPYSEHDSPEAADNLRDKSAIERSEPHAVYKAACGRHQ
jgi:hypothetical protein